MEITRNEKGIIDIELSCETFSSIGDNYPLTSNVLFTLKEAFNISVLMLDSIKMYIQAKETLNRKKRIKLYMSKN